jgi:ABC-type nitrate/sulfonate/bicarbonate transport system substrate-binding protein
MMTKVRLAYRDEDRTPVLFCIKEMALRHYGVDVEIVLIKGTKEYEAALFNDSCDVIIEHLEYLYPVAARGKKVTMFCAPSLGRGLELVVPDGMKSVEALRGGTLAVRTSGRPHSVVLWLRTMGLENDVKILMVGDDEVGRWGQWKKVRSGECVATFMSPLYVPHALAAGLTVLAVPDLPVVAHYAQACLSEFARANSDLLRDYVKAVIHAVCLMILRKDEALEIVAQEPMRRMKIAERSELERQFDLIVKGLQLKPYPTPQAIFHTFEIAAAEFGAVEINPLTLWDLHWVKELDDEGFIDNLINRMK